jgi:hypothetical protein
MQVMKKQTTLKSTIKLTAIFYAIALVGIVVLINSCRKSCEKTKPPVTNEAATVKNNPSPVIQISQGSSEISVVTVAAIRKSGDGTLTEVMFNEKAELFTVNDASIIAGLQDALNNNTPVKITVNPWKATVLQLNTVSREEASRYSGRQIINSPSTAHAIDLARMDENTINNLPAMAVINTTSTVGLTDVIPDMATAQQMFDYIAHQCCALGGPFAIDYCISFQYCEDGCYARAHKMCWILNNTYNYATHKIFSFANAGVDELCVKGEKWGGCCVNWWYHVAPLVNIKTPGGTKAYVFDPAMFDQPVLLATWLHAQQNPACVPHGDVPHVTMINIQPTSSYAPSSGSGFTFSTDPFYTSTNSTLVSYSPLLTCP